MVGQSPIRELVVKLHERCNLACDYCYMYEAADQSWRNRPAVMAAATVEQTAWRLAEHAKRHDLDHVRVVLHGGEPLLAGTDVIARTVHAVRDAVAADTRVSFALQTNGVLLDDRFVRLFRDQAVRVGVSIDGSQLANDRHRRHANGRSSYASVVRGIELLARPENRDLYGGLLCTIDVDNDPIDTYESLLSHHPPRIDFLLPHGNWAFPPPRLAGRSADRHATPTPYADWLIAIFDRWYDAPVRRTGVRLFESIMALLLGGASSTEAIGPGVPTSIVVESDGSIEGNDALKTTAPAGGATGLTVFSHSFDDLLAHPLIASSRLGPAGLGPSCRSCPVVNVCGGGLHAHRFAAGGQFDNPSVFCADLYRLIRHLHARLTADLSARVTAGTPGAAPHPGSAADPHPAASGPVGPAPGVTNVGGPR
jgi:uncharacterized protein